ncbi:FMN-dependent NADH-azoreductase [Amycolatopsis saalfeldensis]|uniref:FMN dependent NADH:quinone oxidoreductase n=1 Tax=Amycolatopsis saalfeldensis TaxID=394193 RepID=A0A1H8YFD9_9PSEU|nr:NAD(P)H-dependent oxidoreductase [Amycolatopsis saalfeldensis]SEP50960.1 FMN-dependent NADH-azoreductase [Amycolatopsis saalfeldensis]
MTDMLTEALLLHLDSSADGAESVSRRLTALFASAWRGPVRRRDLAEEPVPLIRAPYTTLGRRVERRGATALDDVAALAADEGELREWALTRPLIDQVRAAHTVLLGVPMYNFTVPATLKAWIDRLTFPGAFTGPATGEQVLRGTNFVVVLARGGGYGPGTPREAFDFQLPYLRAYLTNLGVAPERLSFVKAELTRVREIPALAGMEPLAAESLATAIAEVTELAGKLQAQ